MTYGWNSLRHFTNWWWRNGQPYKVPDESVKTCEGSHEWVLFRAGQYQVEQVTLLPNIPVPPHAHPNIDTYETHLTGVGNAWIEDVHLPYSMDYESHHPRARRLLIPAGTSHWGMADTVVVALSFQHWHNAISPTFITDDWVGEEWK